MVRLSQLEMEIQGAMQTRDKELVVFVLVALIAQVQPLARKMLM